VTESPSSTSSRAAFLQAAGADRSSVGGIGTESQSQRDTFSRFFALNNLSDFASVRDVNIESIDNDNDTGTSSMSSRAAFLQAAGADRDAVDDANVDDPFPTKFSLQESIARAKENIRQSPEISNARIVNPGEQQTLSDAFSQRVQELGVGDPTEFNILERLIGSKKRNDISFGSMGPGERKGGVFTDIPGEIRRSTDTDTNVDLKTGFDRAENLVKSMNVKGTFEQPDNADQLNRMLHGGMLVTDGSGDKFVPPNAPDPTDIPDGMDRPSDPTPERVLANKFLRLASQSSVFDASLSDFDERVDESNIDGPRAGDVATEFARLGRTKTLEDTRFVDRDDITDVIKDAAAADFEEADIFQSESPTDVKDIVQQNEEELFDSDIATDVFQQAIRKDGGLTKPNINEAIDEVRGGELAEQEAQFESTLRKLSEFKDTTLNVDNAMESLIDSTETAEIDLENASEEVDRLNEALTDAFLSDDTFLPFSPDGNADPDRSDLDPEDTPNLRDLLRVLINSLQAWEKAESTAT
jgi:hypothetical protein